MSEWQHDLIRHVRSELLDANLISEEEYASLAEDSGSVARLETYDQMRATIDRLSAPLSDDEKQAIAFRFGGGGISNEFDRIIAARAQKGQENG